MNDARNALEECLDPDEYHTVARFSADTGSEEFLFEFGTHGTEAPVWNIAGSPPVDEGDFEERFVHGSGSGYVLVNSEAETADEALNELEELAVEAGATRVELEKTFAGAENPLKDLYDVVQHYIVEPIERRVGRGGA